MTEEIKTFKEAIKYSEENIYDDNAWGLWTDIIKELQKSYAPTIKMHKVGKEQLLWFLENSNFEQFLENVGETQKLYTELSIEDLMQAWLHPENIEVK